jgi:hypothetical protein
MKTARKQSFNLNSKSACTKALEILHTQGLESAEAWIVSFRINKLYDRIEEDYLKTRKIIYIN